jgi:hypothetical protein
LRQARFSVWQVERPHEIEGLRVVDIIGGEQAWLVDQGLAQSATPDMMFASRFCWPDEFAMTCGITVPVDRDLLEVVVDENEGWMRSAEHSTIAGDPRFALAIYRAAIAAGIMDNVEYREPMIAS